MEPIERVPFTSPSINKDIYTVPARGTYAWPPPEFASDITLLVGGRVVATDDAIYPWELNDDGYVVFTGKQPLEDETIIMQVSQEAVFLDLNKIKFPKGYNLDARVLNRTLFDALYTSNKMWMYGHDALQAWFDSNNIPDAGALTDNYTLISLGGIWTPRLPAVLKQILNLNSNSDVVVNDLSATASLSGTEVSATNFHCDTLSSTIVSGISSLKSAITYAGYIPDSLVTTTNFSNDLGDIVVSGANPAGLIIDASSSIVLGDLFSTVDGLFTPRIDASGFLSSEGTTSRSSPPSVAAYNDAFPDPKNVNMMRAYPRQGLSTGSADHKIKADNAPTMGSYIKVNDVDLDSDNHPSDTFVFENLDSTHPISVFNSFPGPYIQNAYFIGLNQKEIISDIYGNRYTFKPLLVLKFDRCLFNDINTGANPLIENGQGKYHVQGTGTVKVRESATPANDTTKFISIDNSRVHFIGSNKYYNLMLQYRVSEAAIATFTDQKFPVSNEDAISMGKDPFSYAVVELYRDTFTNVVQNSILLFEGETNTEYFEPISTGTKTMSIDANILITLKGDTHFS